MNCNVGEIKRSVKTSIPAAAFFRIHIWLPQIDVRNLGSQQLAFLLGWYKNMLFPGLNSIPRAAGMWPFPIMQRPVVNSLDSTCLLSRLITVEGGGINLEIPIHAETSTTSLHVCIPNLNVSIIPTYIETC